MKTITLTKSISHGTIAKGTYYTAKLGETFEVIRETKAFYYTNNPDKVKIPKWATT